MFYEAVYSDAFEVWSDPDPSIANLFTELRSYK